MSQKIAIELGRNYVKIVEGTFGNILHVDNFAETHTQDNLILNDIKAEPNLLYEIVGNMILEHNFKKKNVSLVLSGLSNMIVREMVLPYVNEEKTFNLLSYEAKQYFPTNIENYLIDYKQLEIFQEGKLKKQRILLIALPRTLIEDIINVCSKLGIRLEKIDIEPNTLAKLVILERKHRKLPNDQLIMAVNIARSYITIALLNANKLILSKSFPSSDMERMFDENENSEYFLEYFFTYTINEIVDNIVKFYDFYRSRETNNKELAHVYLMGEVCQHIDISDFLKAKLSNTEMTLLTELSLMDKKQVLSKADVCNFITAFSALI